MPGDRLKLRALIEGYEIPCVSCYVNAAVNNGPAAATVQIVALTSAMYIAPNSLIRVYYLDTASLRTPTPGEPSVEALYTNEQPVGSYKRLFTGKITGFSYRRAGNEKAVVLQCLDDGALWQSTTNMTGGKDAATTLSDEFTDAITLGNAQKGWASKMQSIMDEGASGVKVAQDFSGVKGALGAMINLLLAAGGVFPPATNPGVEARRGDNLWSTFEELRTHLSMQLGTDDGVSASTVFVWDKMKKALFSGGGGVAGGKQSVSFYDIAQFICQQIFYNMSPQPCPYYSPYDGSGIDSVSYPITNYKNPGLAPIYAQLQEISNRMAATVNNLDARMKASTIVGSGYTYASQFRAMDINYGVQLLKQLVDSVDGMVMYLNSLGTATDPGVVSALASKLGTIKADAKAAYDKFQVQGEYDGAGSKSTSKMYEANYDFYWDDLNLAIYKIVGEMQSLLAGAQIDTTSGTVSVNSKGRLLTQIIMPDIWMCAPPVCNVIFQDEYEAFDMARNFMEEATKVIVTVTSSGGGQGDEFLSAITLGESGGGGSNEFTVGTVQAWERFSGPVIKRVAVPSMFALDGSTAKSYGQMVANYMFYNLRFSTRTAQVRTKFLPRLVLGAPGAILVGRIPSSWVVPLTATDTPEMLPTVESAVQAMLDRGLRPPSQILGMISGLSHSCSQYDARTTVEMNHARASHPDDEYLVSGPDESKAEVSVSTQITYEDAMTEWRVGNPEKLDILRSASPPSITGVLNTAYDAPYVSSLFATLPGAKDLQSSALSTRADYSEGPDKSVTPDSLQKFLQFGKHPSEIAGTSLDILLKGLMTPALQNQSIITFLQTMGDAESILSSTKSALPTIKSWSIDSASKFLPTGPAGGAVSNILAHGEQPELVPDPSNPTVFLFKKVTIVETVALTPFTGKGSAVEDKLMPDWIKGTYNNASISTVYQKLFGCKAITDPTVLGGDVTKSTETGTAGTQEAALDGLSFYYDRVKRISDVAAMEFIESFTFRPIATMRDCEGYNTFLNPTTGLIEPLAVGSGANSATTIDEMKTKGGIVGFYQGSAGIMYEGLKGLLGADGAGLEGTPLRAFHNAGDKAAVPTTMDTRKERSQRVEYIIRELRSFSGGIVD